MLGAVRRDTWTGNAHPVPLSPGRRGLHRPGPGRRDRLRPTPPGTPPAFAHVFSAHISCWARVTTSGPSRGV